jgi:hypothetical protein
VARTCHAQRPRVGPITLDDDDDDDEDDDDDDDDDAAPATAFLGSARKTQAAASATYLE